MNISFQIIKIKHEQKHIKFNLTNLIKSHLITANFPVTLFEVSPSTVLTIIL